MIATSERHQWYNIMTGVVSDTSSCMEELLNHELQDQLQGHTSTGQLGVQPLVLNEIGMQVTSANRCPMSLLMAESRHYIGSSQFIISDVISCHFLYDKVALTRVQKGKSVQCSAFMSITIWRKKILNIHTTVSSCQLTHCPAPIPAHNHPVSLPPRCASSTTSTTRECRRFNQDSRFKIQDFIINNILPIHYEELIICKARDASNDQKQSGTQYMTLQHLVRPGSRHNSLFQVLRGQRLSSS